MFGPPKTMEGVRNVWWSFLLFVVLQILSVILLVVVVLFLGNLLAPGGPPDPAGALPQLAAVVAVVCGIIVVALVGLIFFLLGFFRMYSGRDEYGPEQARNMVHALWLLLIAIVSAVAGAVFLVLVLFLNAPIGNPAAPFNPPLGFLVGAAALSVVTGFLQNFMVVKLVLALTPVAERQYLWTAFLLGVGGSISAAVGTFVLTPQLAGGIFPGVGPAFTPFHLIGAILGFLSLVLFAWRFRAVYQLMQAGRILPVPRLPPAELWPAPQVWQPPPNPPP